MEAVLLGHVFTSEASRALKPKYVFSEFKRLDFQDQGVRGAVLSLGKVLPRLILASAVAGDPRCPFACACIVPVSALVSSGPYVFTPSSLCVSVQISLFLSGYQSYWVKVPPDSRMTSS